MPIPSFALPVLDMWGAGQGAAGTWLCPGGTGTLRVAGEAGVAPHTTSPPALPFSSGLSCTLLPCVGDLDAGTDIINRFSFSPCHRSRS